MQLERPVDGGNSGTPGNRPGRLTWDSGNRKTFTDLSAALLQHQPIILLIGEEGAGKTALLDDWAEECAGSICLARPNNLEGGPDAVMLEVSRAFDVQAEATDKNALTAALRQKLTSLIDLGDIPVLIVDDAHELDSNKIELLRLLSSIRHGGVPLLRLILSGTPKLEDLVRTNDVRGRDQVVVVNLNPLSLDAGVRLFRSSIQAQTDGAVTCGIDEARTILGKIGTLPGAIVEAAGKIAATAMAGRWSRVSDKRSLDIVSKEKPAADTPPTETSGDDAPQENPAVERMIGDHGSLPTSIRESEDPRLLLRWAFGMNNNGGQGAAPARPQGLSEPEAPAPTPPEGPKPTVRPGSPAAALEALDATEEDELKFPEPSAEVSRELGRLAERERGSDSPKIYDPSGFSDREKAAGQSTTEVAATPEMQAELSRDLRLALANESKKPSNMRFVYYGGAFAAGLALALFGWPIFRDQVLPPAPQTAQRPSGELITAISVGTVTDQTSQAAQAPSEGAPGIPETAPPLTAMIEQIKMPEDDDRIVASRFSDLAGTGVRFPEPDDVSRPAGLANDAPVLTRATFSEQPSVPVGLSAGTSTTATVDGVVRAESEVAILKTERDTLASDISTLDAERAALSQEIGDLEGQIADLTRQAAALSTAIADSETTMTGRADRIEALSAQEATLAGRLESLKASEADIQTRLATERDALDAAIANAAKFEAEAGARQAEAEALMANLTTEIEDLSATRDALAASVSQAETAASQAVSRLGETQTALTEESERLEAIKGEIAASEERLLALQAEAESTAVAAATAGQNAAVDAEIAELEDKLAALSAEESAQTAELDELNGAVAALRDEIAALTAARDDSRAALEATNADRAAAETELAALASEIDATQDAISAAAAQIAVTSRNQDSAEAAAARTAELEAEVAALTEQLANVEATGGADAEVTDAEVEALSAELARLRTEESVARTDLSDAMRQLTENREAARKAAEEEQTLSAKLDEMKASVAALQAEEAEIGAELAKARAELADLDSNVGTATAQSNNEIASLTADIERLTEDRAAAETRLAAARSQLKNEVSEAEARRDAARAAADQETRRLTEVIASVEEIEAKRLSAMEELRLTEEQLTAERAERQTALAAEQDELASDIEAARAELDRIRAETRAEQTVLSEARAERTTLEAQVASIKSEFATETERFQTEVSRLSEEETGLVASIEAKLTQLDGIVTDLNSNQSQTAGFAARSEEQTRDAEELSTKRAELLAEVETAEQTLAALREDIADEQARRVAALAGEAPSPVPAGPAIAAQPPRRGESEAPATADAAPDEPVGRSRELVERVLVDLPGIERLDNNAVDRLTEELVAGACLTDALSAAAGRINRHMLAGLMRELDMCS